MHLSDTSCIRMMAFLYLPLLLKVLQGKELGIVKRFFFLSKNIPVGPFLQFVLAPNRFGVEPTGQVCSVPKCNIDSL